MIFFALCQKAGLKFAAADKVKHGEVVEFLYFERSYSGLLGAWQ